MDLGWLLNDKNLKSVYSQSILLLIFVHNYRDIENHSASWDKIWHEHLV